MHVHEIMTKDVITADVDTPISQILSQMTQRNIHQVPVLSRPDKNHMGGELAGVVVLNKIVTREIDPAKTTAKALMTHTAKISSDDNLDRAAELIIGSNQRAIPVWDGELVGILSEEDMMKVVSMDGTASDIAKPCICVDETSGIGKIKELMVYKNISRVGVTKAGKPNELLGIIGTMELVKALAPGSRSSHGMGGSSSKGKPGAHGRGQRNRGYMEASPIDKTTVMNFLHNAPFVDGKEPLSKVIELLRSNEEVIVKSAGELGIITPKDVLRNYVSTRSVALVQIIGLDKNVDSLDVARVQQKASQIIQHIAKFADLQPMKIHIKAHRKQGPKSKYSVKIEFPTSLGTFSSNLTHGKGDKSYGQLITLVQRALDDVEREVRRAQDKFRKPDRAWISEMRGRKEEGIGTRDRKIKKSGKRL